MPRIHSNGVDLEYEISGHPDHPVVLLVMGLGLGLRAWPQAFIDGLLAQSLRVLRLDNRDCGRSSYLDTWRGPPLALCLARAAVGLSVPAPYRLSDMARDAVGLLDALRIARAHWVGVSLGGMVAQQAAIQSPDRVAALTCVMSAAGSRRAAFWPQRPAAAALLRRPPRGASHAQMVEHFVALIRVIGSPTFPIDDALLRQRLDAALDHGYRPDGTRRQLLAMLASGDRSAALAAVTAPTLIIHGDRDPLVPPAAGEDLAQRIPGARLQLIRGMGHDLPPAVLPTLVELIAAHDRAARGPDRPGT